MKTIEGASSIDTVLNTTPRAIPKEQALITAAQAGDSVAFDRLVESYQEYLYRLLLRACHHPQDAEEVTVEAFARAYERLAQFEGRSSFITWLGRIATNLCFRRREKVELSTVSLDEAPEQSDAGTIPHPPSPEQQILQDEMRRTIRAAIADLPEPDQTVLRLRDIEGVSAREVSACTGLTIAAVKARLHRARQSLRVKLNAYFLADNNAG